MWDWIVANYFELIASLLGLIGIFLQIKQKPLYWLVSLVMVTMYIWVYLQAKFYADMSLQVYYFGVSIYGWFHWVFGRNRNNSSEKPKLSVAHLKSRDWKLSILLSVILFIVIYFILKKFTDSPVPLGDAFTTSLSFIATWMLARKIIENWLFWIVVDAVSVGLYFYKGLYPTAILFIVLTFMAFIGYREWKNDLKKV
jgi:nicotinamide mononucleotide transporter